MDRKHIIEKRWKSGGLDCVVLIHPFGHRCGYVGIPKTHKLYKSNYESAPLNVHGGVTFGGGGKGSEYPIKSELWWFGFDCNHWGMDKPDPKFTPPEYSSQKRTGKVRTLAYCIKECNNMAKQLTKL